jgi:hypothetical protein
MFFKLCACLKKSTEIFDSMPIRTRFYVWQIIVRMEGVISIEYNYKLALKYSN